MFCCLTLSCSCAQEKRVEQSQVQVQNMRLRAVTVHGRERLFDSDRAEAAWKFAGKRGSVFKWSHAAGQYFRLPRPGSSDPVAELVEAIG